MTTTRTTRRLLCQAVGLLAAGPLAGRAARASLREPLGAASASGAADAIARLAFVNTHTGERLDVVYREGTRYLADAISAIDRLLRDHRSGDVHPIDRGLLDQLDRLAALLGAGARPFHVISGYRSPATNAKLAARSGGVASNSLHTAGRAIDVRLPGMALSDLHRAALSMQAGGVGFYSRSDFVHLDSGRVRRW